MNKKGFTLIELLAVIALLAIIVTIGVPVINSIAFNIKQSMLDKKAEMIEKQATLYGEDIKKQVVNSNKRYNGNNCVLITVKDLVNEKLLDKDNNNTCGSKTNGCISDPTNSSNFLDNEKVVIYYKNNRVHAKFDLKQEANCS